MKHSLAFAIIAFLLFFALPLIQKTQLISLSWLEPYEIIPDSQVSLLPVTYEEIIPQRVRGSLEVTLNSEENYAANICPITEGQVRKYETRFDVYCKESAKKTAEISDSLLAIELLSGTYFLQFENEEPSRVIIHKGQKAIAKVNL